MKRSVDSWFGKRRADGESVAFWHAQNLNERKHGPDGPMWRHGRAWFHWSGLRTAGKSCRFGIEWLLLDRKQWPKIGLEINQTFGDDYDLSTTLSLPLLGALYFHVGGIFPRAWKGDAKNFSIALYQEYLWIEFCWTDPAETWGKNKNRFPAFRLSFDWKAFLFGKMEHKLEHLSDWKPILIPMPEASYPAHLRIERRTWTRKRWPGKLVKVAADIRIEGGVPIPGKGENSWDCGEDAIMGMGSTDTSEAGAIAAVVKSALSARERYESISWRPREQAA